MFLGKQPGLLSGNRGQIKKAERCPKGILWRKKRRFVTEPRGPSAGQLLVKYTCTSCRGLPTTKSPLEPGNIFLLQPRSKTYNCKAAHLKGWLGVWWAAGIPLSETERQNWITDYSKASADLDSTFTLRQPRTKGRYLTGKLLKQEVGSLWETRGNFGMSRWALACGILSVQHRRALKWKRRRRR